MFYSLNPGNVWVDPTKVGQAASDIRVNTYDRTTEDLMADWIFTNCSNFDSKFYLPKGFHFQNLWIHFRVKFDSNSALLRINLLRPDDVTTDGLAFNNNSWGFTAATANASATNSYGSAAYPPEWSDFDIELTSTGAKLYINGAYVGDDTSDPSNSDLYAVLIRPDGGSRLSEICIADQDTRGMRIQSTKPQGLGAGNTFSGNVADVQSEPFTLAGLSSTGAGDEGHLTLPALNELGMKVSAIQSSMQGDISGVPDSPFLEHVLFDGTNEHVIGYTHFTADSEHEGRHVVASTKADGSPFTQAELNNGELRLKNIPFQLKSNIASSGTSWGYFRSIPNTVIAGSPTINGQALDWCYINNSNNVAITTDNQYSGGSTSIDLVLGATGGPILRFNGIPKTSNYTFEATYAHASELYDYMVANPSEIFYIVAIIEN